MLFHLSGLPVTSCIIYYVYVKNKSADDSHCCSGHKIMPNKPHLFIDVFLLLCTE